MAEESDFYYLDRFDFTCLLSDNLCWAFDDNGEKNFFDYSHFTPEGIKFFGKKIYKIQWLEKITKN